ncbi:major facilitator superfamily domain-containing protein [Aspergillus multicolor]|uniref:major facilitator superfamily domain-containing protein n=1 Tax=Aspergillus multicolor TaxID=41759 RepID=UPI003CCD17B6
MTAEENTFRPDWRLRCIFGVIGLLNFAAALDATSISVAIPRISEDLGGTAVEAFWSGTSFLVCSCVIYARMLFGAVVAFTLSAILAAVSQHFGLLLAGRCIQGIGGGGIIALTEVLIADLIPLHERGKWMSFRAVTWAFGTVLGPVVGGALADNAWRWIFWISLPFCGLGLPSLDTPLLGGLRRLCPLCRVPIVAYESFIPRQPLIPIHIFRNPTTAINYLGCFLHGMVMWCVLYYLPLYYEACLTYSAVVAGVAMLPLTLMVAPLSAITGIVIAKTGRYRWAIWMGWALTTLGIGILYLLEAGTSIPKWIFVVIVSGLGLGTLFTSMMLAVQASADVRFLSITATMAAFFRTLGQTVGVAIGGVVIQNRLGVQAERSSERAGLEQAYASSVGVVWLTICGIAGVGFISGLFVHIYPMI